MAGTWKRLAHVELSSNGDSLDTGTFDVKENLKVIMYRKRSGSVNSRIQLNGDTGSNYAARYHGAGNSYGSDGTVTSQTSIYSHALTANDSYTTYNIINKANKEKLIIIEEANPNSSGAGNAPDRSQTVAKWTNTSDSITSIQMINTDSGDLVAGSYITVFGATGDTVTDTTDNNSIFEENDTGKHYIWNATSDSWTEIG